MNAVFDLALAAAVCRAMAAGGFIRVYCWISYKLGMEFVLLKAFWRDGDWESAVPARVIAQQRKFWRVRETSRSTGRERAASWACGGRGRGLARGGRLVVAELHGEDTTAVIQEVLPRRSKFVRKSPGKKMERAGDRGECGHGAVVSGIGRRFQSTRVERYLAQCWESGRGRHR